MKSITLKAALLLSATAGSGLALGANADDGLCRRVGIGFTSQLRALVGDAETAATFLGWYGRKVETNFRHGTVNEAVLIRPAGGTERYLSPLPVIAKALGAKDNAIFVSGAGELRYLPTTIESTDLIVLADGVGPLSEARVERVLRVARLKKIRIFLVVQQPLARDDLTLLAYLAKSSGGQLSSRQSLFSCF